jgi:hypothetical protein
VSLWPENRRQWAVVACNVAAALLLLGAGAFFVISTNKLTGVIVILAVVLTLRFLVITLPDLINPPPRRQDEGRS